MGAAFTVETPDNPLVCVTSEQHIIELEQAPEDHFSLHAIAKDVGLRSLQRAGNLKGALQMFQPKYTMNGYELKEEPKANSVGHSRVLRTLLTSKLPVLHSAICSRVAESFAQDLPNNHGETGMIT